MSTEAQDEWAVTPGTPYELMGGHATFAALVHRFYAGVATDPLLRPLYPEADLGPAEDRLRMFLEQYWGGPKTYSEQRGHPRLRMRHAPYVIGVRERDAWLGHMRVAVDASIELPLEQRATLWAYLEHAATFMINAADPSGSPTPSEGDVLHATRGELRTFRHPQRGVKAPSTSKEPRPSPRVPGSIDAGEHAPPGQPEPHPGTRTDRRRPDRRARGSRAGLRRGQPASVRSHRGLAPQRVSDGLQCGGRTTVGGRGIHPATESAQRRRSPGRPLPSPALRPAAPTPIAGEATLPTADRPRTGGSSTSVRPEFLATAPASSSRWAETVASNSVAVSNATGRRVSTPKGGPDQTPATSPGPGCGRPLDRPAPQPERYADSPARSLG